MTPYAYTKIKHAYLKDRPLVSVSINEKSFDQSAVFNFNEIGYKFAFGVDGQKEDLYGTPLDDLDIVEWVPTMCVTTDSIENREYVPLAYHKCNQSDWE
jgi:hypothetical protein